MPVNKRRLASALASAVALTAGLGAPARADDDRRSPRAPPLSAHARECGACHMAYPPALLPAASWRRLMAGLQNHFGTDASLERPAQQSIETWLTAHAAGARETGGDGAMPPPPDDRITRAPWFVREHREVPAATWSRPAIKSPSNCNACHGRAEQGDFSEHGVRIPR